MYSSEVSSWAVAIRSALRSLWPILVLLAGMVQGGLIEAKDMLTLNGLSSIIVAIAGKGVVTGLTAKTVSVKGK
jgi:hypothetical protein